MVSLAFPNLSKRGTLRDGTVYGYVHVKPAVAGKPTLLFLHGYPSAAYDWRHQIAHFSSRGYGLIVPDLLGYGDTSKPHDLAAYTMHAMSRHIVELLDAERIDRVAGVAHDW